MTASTGNVSGRIFMSYRREDTAYPAGWLYDRLAGHFASGQVFKDIDSIELGDDFVEVITTAVGSCDVLLLKTIERRMLEPKSHESRSCRPLANPTANGNPTSHQRVSGTPGRRSSWRLELKRYRTNPGRCKRPGCQPGGDEQQRRRCSCMRSCTRYEDSSQSAKIPCASP